MSYILTKYSVPCVTESTHVLTGYRDSVPDKCPNNGTHEIDSENIQIIATYDASRVLIAQNSNIETGGYYRSDSFNNSIGATGTTIMDITYPYNVSVFSMTVQASADNIDDEFSVISVPDTTVGVTTVANVTNDTIVTMASVYALNPGFMIKITDGVNTDDLGEIISLDYGTGEITVTNPVVNNYDAGATVKISVPRINNFRITKVGNTQIGLSRYGSTGLAAGKVARFVYTNNTLTSKVFSFLVELEY